MASPPWHPHAPSSSQRENRLARETSPYLLQHKLNPVDWWPWGPDALSAAQRANKPILLSVGYAACHWCHVMAHESFEDESTAAVMNELFVNIKVDREERPDIDQIYMNALHHLGEQGGWPLTMFLTPAGEPVWGGTYFPKTSRYGRPAFVDVLHTVANIFAKEPEKIAQNRDALMERLADAARPADRVVIGPAELDQIARQIGGAFDPVHGGLRGAPKFPNSAMYEFLWRAGARTGQASFTNVIANTLERICEGGIYDHLGGGFSRYSVDERWLVPHFEKMLYDNAQLLELLALAHQRTKNPLFHRRARETVEWLKREMTTGEGAFCASLDADSEGEEGKFYVWSFAEIEETLGPEGAAFFAANYDVTREGNFEGHNILNRLKSLDKNNAVQEATQTPDFMLQQDRSINRDPRIAAMQHDLFIVRSKRVRPGLDDKVLADWNGLMIAALVNAGTALNEPSWIEIAARAFGFIVRSMTQPGPLNQDRLGHSWREGRLLVPGLASDFAAMIRAALALYEATAERTYLDRACAWQRALDSHYANPATDGYFLTADDAEGLIVRPAATTDDATPNPNGLTAQNLLRLAVLAGDDRWREQADRLFDGVLARASDNLFSHVSLLNALDLRLRGAEIVVTGQGASADALLAAARALPHIDRIVLAASNADALPPSHPAREKITATAAAAAFICVGATCSLPVTRPEQIAETLSGIRK
jgi:uncharacterized protein